MNSSRTLLLLLIIVFAGQTLSARQISSDKALSAAKTFVQLTKKQGLRSEPVLSLAYACTGSSASFRSGSSDVYYYAFNIDNSEGFILIAGDDLAMPVLGYSDKGSFQYESINKNLAYWLNEYQRQIAWAIETNVKASDTTTKAWDGLTSGSLKASTPIILSTANWSQDEPYSTFCPVYKAENCVTGCVATAMAIVMKYHQWPLTGTGSVSYTSTDIKKDISVTFGTYTWSNMLNRYTKDAATQLPTWTETQANEVATLMYHCGASAHTNYNTASTGSSASTSDAAIAMVNNFGYDKGIGYKWRDYYTDEEWNSYIKTEIDNRRPVMYGGANANNEGHQFIIDGYEPSGFYHINWGWGGYENGYYLLNALDPNPNGQGGTSDSGFLYQQDMLINMKKAEASSTYDNELVLLSYQGSKGMTRDSSVIIKDTSFNVDVNAIWNIGLFSYTGYVGIGLVDQSNQLKEIISCDSISKMDSYYLTSATFDCKVTKDIAATDKLQTFYSTDKVNWIRVRGTSETINELPVTYVKTDIKTIRIENGFKIYPNPVKDMLTIQGDNQSHILQVDIIDLTGRMIRSVKYGGNENVLTLQVADINKGSYIVRIRTNKGVIARPVIKN